MKRFSLLAATLAVSLSLPTWAQTQIAAPGGWKTQTKTGGATTYTPPGLRAGETYSITVYEAAPLGGKTLGEFVSKFGGTVGTGPGQLVAALKINAGDAQQTSATGVYRGPNGKQFSAAFMAFSFDGGQNISVARILYSTDAVFFRYKGSCEELAGAIAQRARDEAGQGAASNAAPNADLPDDLPKEMKVGGEIVPGVYKGWQSRESMFGRPSILLLRVYIYANGEYRICDQHDEDFNGGTVGHIKYNRKRAMLDIRESYSLSNNNALAYNIYCYYGRDKEGTPMIYGSGLYDGDYTALFREGPPTGRKSQSEEDAPARALEAKKKAAQDKLNRIQTRVAPGRGVPASQVGAIVHNFDSTLRQTLISPGSTYIIPNFGGVATYGTNAPIYGMRHDITNDTYLLLRDGTLYRGLTVAPDQLDTAASRRKEPEKWGLWKNEGGKTRMSFEGKPYEEMPGKRVFAGAPNSRFSGRYTSYGVEVPLAITFEATGRFKRKPVDPKNNASVPFMLSAATKEVPGGDIAGTYSIDGFSLTLRYDNGKIERMPFFFGDKTRQMLWFEGSPMSLDKPK